MYETHYNPQTGVLTVTGDHFDIDEALYDGQLNNARQRYRSECVSNALQLIENSGPPVDVSIKVNGPNILTADLEMTLSPVLNSPSTAASQKRVQDITALLEEHHSGASGITFKQTQLK